MSEEEMINFVEMELKGYIQIGGRNDKMKLAKKMLLQRYKEQQKEIEDLKRYIKNAEFSVVDRETYIRRTKVEDKIMECIDILYSMEKEEEMKLNYVYRNSMNSILAQISILQSLLEKED